MAEGRSAKKYPDKLMEYLKDQDPASEREKRHWTNLDIARRWKFVRSEDTGECDHDCPCGKKGIRYLLYIQNLYNTRIEVFVGSKCITIFEEGLQEVLKVALRLVQYGLYGTYKGITNTTSGGRKKMRFQIDGKSGLVKHKDKFQLFLNFVPVYKAGRHWEIAVLPPLGNSIESEDYADGMNLSTDGKYRIKLAMKEWYWESKGISGFSLYIISMEKLDLDTDDEYY